MQAKHVLAALAASVFLAVTAGCQKNEPSADKGPAEKVGQKLDEAAGKAAVEINKAAEQAGKGLQKAGEKLESTAKDAKSKNEQSKNEK